MTILARLEERFNRLQHDYLIGRIASLEALIAQRAPGRYEVVYDLRDLLPDERATVLAIHADMQAREASAL